MFCVVSVTVMGWLGVEVLLDGLSTSSVSRFWCIEGKGLPVVSFIWAGA